MYLQFTEIHVFIKFPYCDVSFHQIVLLHEIRKVEGEFIGFGAVH